jgi:putative nucleotidyltransferase with HDIG domain
MAAAESTRTTHPTARSGERFPSAIAPFVRLIAVRDARTARHSERVATVVAALGERLGFGESEQSELTVAGWLHDLGKIGVPDAILLKDGPLEADEWEVMRCHAAWGADALAEAPGMSTIADAVRSHHERWDGGGYPDAIAGEDIPLASRVIAVCDALCAITEERPYRDAVPLADALAIVRAGAGKNFDAGLTGELVALAGACPALFTSGAAASPPTPIEDVAGRRARFRRTQPAQPRSMGHALAAPRRLPALVTARERVLELLSDPNPQSGRVADAIESDPGLTAAVLRAANAATPRAAATVPSAIELLDHAALTDCVTTVDVFDVLDRRRSVRMDQERFRQHAISVRRAARHIARTLDHRAPDELAVAALLHDVGKLALAEGDPGYPDEVLRGARTPEERTRAERLAYGFDHAAATAVTMRRWRLPDRVVAAAAAHHEPADAPDARILQLADLVVHHAAGEAINRGALLACAAELGQTLADVRAIFFELEATTAGRAADGADSPLTRAEATVLRGVASGKRNRQIAAQLGISESTVRSHLFHIYPKLGVGDRARAVLVATDRGWI